MTCCDPNSGFYGKGMKSVYDQMAKGPVAQWQLYRCGESLDLEEVVERFTRHVIYGDNKTSTIAEARAAKWKRINNKSYICLPPAPTLPPRQLLGASNVPPWLGAGG